MTDPTSTHFYDHLHAVAVLYEAKEDHAKGNDWILNQDKGTLYPFSRPSPLKKVEDNIEIQDQLYVDPVVVWVQKPDKKSVPRKWILVISVGSGDKISDENRVSQAWRIEVRDKNVIHMDYLGPFGGVTGDRVGRVLGPQYPGGTGLDTTDTVDSVMVQATFGLVNTLTQTTVIPLSYAVQLQPQFGLQTVPEQLTTNPSDTQPGTSKAKESAKSCNIAIAGQISGSKNPDQPIPPAPAFLMSFNAIIRVGTPADKDAAEKAVADAEAEIDRAAAAKKLTAMIKFENNTQTELKVDELTKLYQWVIGLPEILIKAIRAGNVPVRITGKASPPGSVTENMGFSQKRADSVRAVLQGAASKTGGARTTGGLLGGEKVEFRMLALGEFPSVPKSLDPDELVPDRVAKVSIDVQDAKDGVKREALSP